MVENRPWLDFLAHAILLTGVVLVAFPLYVTFVASTLTYDQIVTVPMPLLPGDQLIENYSQVLRAGSTKGSAAPVSTMLLNSLVMAVCIAVGKIAISILSAFAIVYFRFPLRRFWTIVFPLLSPTTFFLLVINIVYAFFGTFGVVDATTQGGPAGSTQILVYKVYYDGVKAADLGGSAAQSVILMLIVVSLTVIQFKFVEKKVQY